MMDDSVVIVETQVETTAVDIDEPAAVVVEPTAVVAEPPTVGGVVAEPTVARTIDDCEMDSDVILKTQAEPSAVDIVDIEEPSAVDYHESEGIDKPSAVDNLGSESNNNRVDELSEAK